MLHVRIFYAWISCPIEQINEFEDLVIKNRLDEISNKQERFADSYSIRTSNLIPQISKFKFVPAESINVSDSNKVWQGRERYHLFEHGIYIWEIAFNIKLEHEKIDQINNMIKIDNSNLFSNAIYRKKQKCTQFQDTEVLCKFCETNYTQKIFEIYKFDSKNELYSKLSQHTKNRFLQKDRNREFILTGAPWRIIKTKSLVIFPNQLGDKGEIIMDAIIWALSLTHSTKIFGKELLIQKQSALPELTILFDEHDEQQYNKFLDLFFLIYFWTNPNFILNKSELRLHLRSLELNALYYAYECIMDEKFWKIEEKLVSTISKLPIDIFLSLIEEIQDLPGGYLSDWITLINPYKHQIPDFSKYEKNLKPIHREISYAMGQHMMKNVVFRADHDVNEHTVLDPMALNEIGNLVGISAGSAHKTLRKELELLVTIGIINKGSPDDIGVTRTRAKTLYYLNPHFPYTQTILYLSKKKNSE